MTGTDHPTSTAAADEGADLMLRWRAGDERAFERLVELHAGPVYALLTRFLGDTPNREDLVQEVFLRVVRARDRYAPSARFSTFLYTIAFNLAANERARAELRRTASLDAWAGGEGDAPDGRGRELVDPNGVRPDSELARADAGELVRSAIAELPAQQRMALILARYEELPYSEIAVALGSSEKAVKSLIHRARESLRARLAPLLEEDYA